MDDMYRIATMVQRESDSKASKMIMAIYKEDKYSEGDEDNIAAFHNYKASIWSKNQNNYSNGQSKSGKPNQVNQVCRQERDICPKKP